LNLSEWQIPLSDIDYGVAEDEAVARVLRSRWLSMGAEVEAFEREFAAHIGTRHAVAVANGTAALQLTMLALGIGPGDEVIQPAINFVAAANMTVGMGAVPVFADITGLQEPIIDPGAIESKITSKTRAVIVMHYGGYLCRIADIRAICEKHGLVLIEDACHAVGGRFDDPNERAPHGAMAGALGDAGCFSFFSNKNMATGEGGMITTDRDDVAQRARLLRSHGMSSMTWDRHRGHANSYDVTAHGFNYRLDEIRAALGRCQLRRLRENNLRRKEIVDAYRVRLSDLPEWQIPFADGHNGSAYHLMVAVAPDSQMRIQTAARLRDAGIQSSLHYPCVAEFSAFARFSYEPLEFSRSFAHRTITLPLYPTMSSKQVDTVCSNFVDACVRDKAKLS
jgi:dTDP-4-amino-4,6-dideoxygalactose transaminase